MERWGCIQDGLVLFQNQFMTGVVLDFEWGEVLFKSGIVFARTRYVKNLRAKNNFMSKVEVRITPRNNHYWLALNSSCSARAATQFLSTSKL